MPRATFLAALMLLTPALGAAQSIEGVWRLVEREVQGGPNPAVFTGAQIQPSLLFYQGSHFAFLIDNATTRRMPDPDATAEEIVAMITPLAYQAGTFERVGSELRYTTVVSINPAAAAPENQPLVRQLESLTADRLETSGTNAETGAKTILKYTRVD